MPLIANTKQSKGTIIEDFYFDIIRENRYDAAHQEGNSMLAFVDMLNELFPETVIWGLTSLSRLVLQSEDRWDSRRHVTVYFDDNKYKVMYFKPGEGPPLEREAATLIEVKIILLVAMKESEGWKDSIELQRLLSENNL